MVLQIKPHLFTFNTPGGTSRGIMTHKKAWFVFLTDENGQKGIGECAIIEGLSPDYTSDEQYVNDITQLSEKWVATGYNPAALMRHPSIRFGLETARQDLLTGGRQRLFDTDFTSGKSPIRINGLIWMGTPDYMKRQIEIKLAAGYTCLKLKIGAIDWQNEHAILQQLRASFPANALEIRVDANGAFSPDEAPRLLDELAELSIHSIEQPIKAGQLHEMAALCASTPCPIALDEELIGITNLKEKRQILETIQPHYIILKPSLHGGLTGSAEWIDLAEKNHIGWWITSALESNIGLNAIAQFASRYPLSLPQGLGTGQLYTENVPSPLHLEGEQLWFRPTAEFDFRMLKD